MGPSRKHTTNDRIVELHFRDTRVSLAWHAVAQTMVLPRVSEDNYWHTFMLETLLSARYIRLTMTTCHDTELALNEIRLLSKLKKASIIADGLAVDSAYRFQATTNAWSWSSNEAMRFEGALFPQSAKFAFPPTMSVERDWLESTGKGEDSMECFDNYEE